MLLVDDAAVAVDPLPHPLQEPLAAQVVAGQPLLGQHALDHELRGDAGVVAARQPEGGIAEHTVPADEAVLDRSGQGVAEVQLAGHVRRRHDHGKRLTRRVDARLEVAGVLPARVPFVFHAAGIVGPRHPLRGVGRTHEYLQY